MSALAGARNAVCPEFRPTLNSLISVALPVANRAAKAPMSRQASRERIASYFDNFEHFIEQIWS